MSGIGAAIGGAATLGSALISKPKAQTQQQTQTTQAPSYLQPYQQVAAARASNFANDGGPEIYRGSTVAGFGDATNQALQGTIQRAQNGSPLIDQAQQYVSQGLGAPISSQFGGANPYASPVGTQQVSPQNVSAQQVGYSQVGSGASGNPYASGQNPFGGASNPGLDAMYDKSFGKAMQSVESQYARGGRNIGASQPVAGDIASSLAAQIYAPAYENERNRQLSYGQQQLGIGAQGFESAQARGMQAGLANQGAGIQTGLANQNAGLQAGMANQSAGLQAGMANQSAGLNAALAGQQIGAQGYESGQNRMLTDMGQQRTLQQNLLGYASPLAAQDYMDLAQMRDAGGQQDAMSQAQLSDQVNYFNQVQQRPQQALDSYIQRLTALQGNQGTTTSTGSVSAPSTNYAAAGLGGALLGSQLYGMYKQPTPVMAQNYTGPTGIFA